MPIRSTANVQQPWHFSDAIGMGSTSIIEPPSGHTTSAPECIPCGCCLPPVLTITAMMGFPPPVALTGCLHPWCIRPLPVLPLPLVGLCKEQCAGQHYHGRIQGTRGTERFFGIRSGIVSCSSNGRLTLRKSYSGFNRLRGVCYSLCYSVCYSMGRGGRGGRGRASGWSPGCTFPPVFLAIDAPRIDAPGCSLCLKLFSWCEILL